MKRRLSNKPRRAADAFRENYKLVSEKMPGGSRSAFSWNDALHYAKNLAKQYGKITILDKSVVGWGTVVATVDSDGSVQEVRRNPEPTIPLGRNLARSERVARGGSSIFSDLELADLYSEMSVPELLRRKDIVEDQRQSAITHGKASTLEGLNRVMRMLQRAIRMKEERQAGIRRNPMKKRTKRRVRRNPSVDFDEFFDAYIEAALFSSTDESTESGGEPLDKNYSSSDITKKTLDKMRADCKKFLREAGPLLDEAPENIGRWPKAAVAGHDFWLTRNGHGSGFWDSDWPEPMGDELTDIAHKFGEVHLYVNRGKISQY